MIMSSGADSIILRNPDVANKYTLDRNTISRFTRGQKAIVYKDTKWQSIETEIFAFKGLRETVKNQMQTFFQNNIGKRLTITRRRILDCGDADFSFDGFLYSDVVNYTVAGKDGCAQVYDVGCIFIYIIPPLALKFLITENILSIITEAGDNLISEG